MATETQFHLETNNKNRVDTLASELADLCDDLVFGSEVRSETSS